MAFLERGLELLAPDGVVGFLVPAKLATTGYARVAREELARRSTIAVAADLRHDVRAAFDATVYPMALVAVHAPPPEGHQVRVRLGEAEGGVPQRTLGSEPWPLFPEAARTAIARLRRSAPGLGERYVCHLGVKTGLNRAFLDPPARRLGLPATPDAPGVATCGTVRSYGRRRAVYVTRPTCGG